MTIENGSIILFSNDDYPKRFNHDQDDLMVITATIHNYTIKRILVDQESSRNILYSVVATSMNIQKKDSKPYISNLIKFFGM